MKKLAKIVCIIVGVAVSLLILVVLLADKGDTKEATDNASKENEVQKEWSAMTYKERDVLLQNSIENKSFVNATEAENTMREAIKKVVRNPKTLDFEWSPSVYNNRANVVEADSGWISVPFKCHAKNDLGVDKVIMGSVMYKYIPETNSLDVHEWSIIQNNQ